MTFVNNIKTSFASTAVADAKNDRADLVQTVLLIAGFAIAALVLVNWLSTAILNKAADAATCIEGSNTYGGSSTESAAKCKAASHSTKNSFTKDSSYAGRY